MGCIDAEMDKLRGNFSFRLINTITAGIKNVGKEKCKKEKYKKRKKIEEGKKFLGRQRRERKFI